MVHADRIERDAATPGRVQRPIVRVRGTARSSARDWIAEEVPVAMAYNGQTYAVMMATPADLEDFALGFSLSEGRIERGSQLRGMEVLEHLEGLELAMSVEADAPGATPANDAERLLPGRSGCGLCGVRALEHAVNPPPPVPVTSRFRSAALRRALEELAAHQPMNAATGSVHAAAWADAHGQILLAREDVGRHNALDKLIGALHRQEYALDAGMLLISSRASYEMVTKAARAGIGFIAAVSAPSALAVDLARGAGVCLVGFARAGGHNVYSHADRLLA